MEREIIGDPLALNAREQRADRSLRLSDVRPPATSDGPTVLQTQMQRATASLDAAMGKYVERKRDDALTEGKMAYMAGKTEAEIIEQGNRYTQHGFLQLKVRDDVNKWYLNEGAGIVEANNRMEPAEYQEYMKQKRESLLEGITDPYARKVALKQLEQYSPELVGKQFAANNEFNREQRGVQFMQTLGSSAATARTVSKVDPNGPLKLSDTPVGPVMAVSGRDRDIGIRTMIGEAASQGDTGLSAVAHVMKNRAVDGRWPTSINGVALQDKQFSAWNAGVGGNSLVRKYGPGNPVYEKAGKIFDAVMSGRHVDPTGGAVYYYSPAGMADHKAKGEQSHLTPTWLAGAAKESGGTVKIGGHVFAGRSRGAAAGKRPAVAPSGRQERLAAWKAGDPNKEAEAAREALYASYEAEGRGRDDPLVKASADEKYKDVYLNGPMGSATGDLNQQSIENEGIDSAGQTEIADAGAANETQQLILDYQGLGANDKAKYTALAMRQGLANGDDTLFRDGGGVSTLMKLGASAEDVMSVQAAASAFQKQQMDNFDAGEEKWRGSVVERASTGANLDSLLAEIDERVKSKEMSDSDAQALARQAISNSNKFKSDGNDLSGNADYLTEVGSLYQQVKTGGLDFETATEQAKSIGKKYGAGDNEVNRVIGQMFSDDQSRQDSVRNEAKAASKKFQANEAKKSKVEAAIARGAGLGTVDGNIDTANAAGENTTISSKQYGVNVIRERAVERAKQNVEQGMDQGDAMSQMYKETFRELQKQDVVDEETKAQFIGALSGNILNKDGSLRADARQAYDVYQMLRSAPDISTSYLAKTIENTEVRALLETAYKLDAGNLTGEQALLRSHELLNDKNVDMDRKVAKDAVWSGKRDRVIREQLYKDGKSWWSGWREGVVLSPEQRTLLDKHAYKAESYIAQRADAFYLENQNITPEVALDMAKQDLQKNSSVVLGNLLLTNDAEPLKQVMGLEQFEGDAAGKAMEDYIYQFGPQIFGDQWPEDAIQHTQYMAAAGNTGFRRDARVSIRYNTTSQQIEVDLFDDMAKGTTKGMTRRIAVAEIGEWYSDQNTKNDMWDNMWNSLYRGAGKVVKAQRELADTQEHIMN